MQPSEEIKSRLDVADVLREYISLQSSGSGLRALCPFHNEKNPSFMVSQEKQIWHCFGCGLGGDIFAFVMQMEGLSFVEALRFLAPKAGVELKKTDPKAASERNLILDILNISAEYYAQALEKSSKAQSAREYLAQRGLNNQTITEWKIGYSPDSWDDLLIFLKKKGFSEADIFKSGMSVKKEFGASYYNRFRGRIMFPIQNINSNIVAFTARVSPEKEGVEKMGKYINSPQTAIYDKSKILFGLDKAKMEIKKQDLAVVAEGQMDVITARQNGFRNLIASSGTALSPEQIKIIKRYSQNLALSFDADMAGQMAADRGIGEAMQAEMNVKVIEVPNGKDPDDCSRNTPDDWSKAVQEAVPAMEYYFKIYLRELDLEKVEDKRKAVQRVLPRISMLENKIEQDFWIKKLSAKIEIEESVVREALAKMIAKKRNPKQKSDQIKPNENQKKLSREERASEFFLALVLKFPFLAELALNKLEPNKLAGEANQSLYSRILMYYTGNHDIDYSRFRDYLENEGTEPLILALLDKLIIASERDFSLWDENKAKAEALDVIIFLKKRNLSMRLKKIEREIKATENQKNKTELDELMQTFQKLNQELRSLN